MKIIVTGATGLIGAECIRLALKNSQVTKVIALARRPVFVPNRASKSDKHKFESVVLEDFSTDYPDNVKEKLRGADACIWNLALTLNNAGKVSRQEARKVCLDYTLTGLRSMAAVANESHPFRFVYTSSVLSEQDQGRSLWVQGAYRKMRGEVESRLFDHAARSGGKVEVQVTKPGYIDWPDQNIFTRTLLPDLLSLIGFPLLGVKQIAAAGLHQALNGYEKDILENEDLLRVAHAALNA